jgi:plasmid stabilization system protein ParE
MQRNGPDFGRQEYEPRIEKCKTREKYLTTLSSFSESDLEAIADYIAQDNPARAVSFIEEIRSIRNFPSILSAHRACELFDENMRRLLRRA